MQLLHESNVVFVATIKGVTIETEYRDRMYDVLNLYEEDYDPKNPFICHEKFNFCAIFSKHKSQGF
jgi:hypothetical protein